MLKHARRATIALTTSALLITGAGAPAQGAGSDVSPPAAKAADWLAGQLDDGLVETDYQWEGEWYSYTDYGLSLDFFFAFDGLGIKKPKRQQILDALESQVDGYVAPGGTVTYAGALGKLLTAVHAQGIDPSTYGEGDLQDRLEGLVHTAQDSELGRAEDGGSTDESDTSNTVGQSFVAQALVVGDSSLADEAVKFLLKQQCSGGYFRVYMNSSNHTCDSGVDGESGASVDATAAAVLALVAVDQHGVAGVKQKRISNALNSAGRWLVTKQRNNGSFAEDGVRNSNSTGLAAQALDQLGRGRAAKQAASWLSTLRVTPKLVRNSSLKRGDIGAVAFSVAALREGKQKGITLDSRYQWRRSTAQAAGGLDSLSS